MQNIHKNPSCFKYISGGRGAGIVADPPPPWHWCECEKRLGNPKVNNDSV